MESGGDERGEAVQWGKSVHNRNRGGSFPQYVTSAFLKDSVCSHIAPKRINKPNQDFPPALSVHQTAGRVSLSQPCKQLYGQY